MANLTTNQNMSSTLLSPRFLPAVSPRLGAGRGQLVSGLLPDRCGGGVAAREVLVGEAAVSLSRHRGVRRVEQSSGRRFLRRLGGIPTINLMDRKGGFMALLYPH